MLVARREPALVKRHLQPLIALRQRQPKLARERRVGVAAPLERVEARADRRRGKAHVAGRADRGEERLLGLAGQLPRLRPAHLQLAVVAPADRHFPAASTK